MKLMLTGGHLAPALAMIEELQNKKYANIQIVFVGRKYAQDFEKTLSLEYKEITQKNILFIPLQSGRFTRILNWRSIKNLFKVIPGLIKAFLIILSQKPDVIMTFGGYIAMPIAFWGFLFRIPIYTHEQTIQPGLANRIIAFFSKKIYLSFPEAQKYFPKNKTIVTGNPVRQTIMTVDKKPFTINKTYPVIYITGGTLGSHSVNMVIKKIIDSLLKCYIVIHQTGDTKEYQDYEDLQKIRDELPKELKNRYFLAKHFYDHELGYVFDQADIVVGRAGANTFFELVTLNKPTIFIPLPWSANGEQELQAKIFKDNGVGEIFHQTDDPHQLITLIDKVTVNKEKYQDNFVKLHHLYPKNAIQIIIDQITTNN